MEEQKDKGGRPPIFETPEQLKQKIDQYFLCFEEGAEKPPMASRPTVTGMVLYLGFASRQSLTDYKKRPEFSDIIKGGLLRVEMIYEEMLLSKTPTGSIFALKNMGWTDKQEHSHSFIEQPLFPETLIPKS